MNKRVAPFFDSSLKVALYLVDYIRLGNII